MSRHAMAILVAALLGAGGPPAAGQLVPVCRSRPPGVCGPAQGLPAPPAPPVPQPPQPRQLVPTEPLPACAPAAVARVTAIALSRNPRMQRLADGSTAFANQTNSCGSGVLIGIHPTADRAWVLTCWHTFRDPCDGVEVRFGGVEHPLQAQIVSQDPQRELVLLVVPKPPGIAPMPVAMAEPDIQDVLGFGGWGGGSYQAGTGRYVRASGEWFQLPGVEARSGDSGGPVWDEAGRVVGVLWGSNGGVYAVRVPRILALLRSSLSAEEYGYCTQAPATVPAAGESPLPPLQFDPGPAVPVGPVAPPADPCGPLRSQVAAIDLRVSQLDGRVIVLEQAAAGICQACPVPPPAVSFPLPAEPAEAATPPLAPPAAGESLWPTVARIAGTMAGGAGVGWLAWIATKGVGLYLRRRKATATTSTSPVSSADESYRWIAEDRLRLLEECSAARAALQRQLAAAHARVAELERQLNAALARATDTTELERLRAELSAARGRVGELERQLADRPVEVQTIESHAGLTRMRQAMERVGNSYPGTRPTIKLIEDAYGLILAGERS